jgi:hypothetical protein
MRQCPVCGVAMQASKSREEMVGFDMFRCLNCDTTIIGAPPPDGSNS